MWTAILLRTTTIEITEHVEANFCAAYVRE